MPSALGTLQDPPGGKDMSYLVYSATANLDPDKWWKIDVIEWWAWAAIDAKACPPKKRAPPQEAWHESRENTISRWVVISSSQLRWSFLIKVMKVTGVAVISLRQQQRCILLLTIKPPPESKSCRGNHAELWDDLKLRPKVWCETETRCLALHVCEGVCDLWTQ